MKIIPIIQCLFEEIESESLVNMEITPIDAPKSPIYLGIAPIDAPKSPIKLRLSPIDTCEARALEENSSGKYRSLQKSVRLIDINLTLNLFCPWAIILYPYLNNSGYTDFATISTASPIRGPGRFEISVSI